MKALLFGLCLAALICVAVSEPDAVEQTLLEADSALEPCYGLTVDEHVTLQKLYLQEQQLFSISDAEKVQRNLRRQIRALERKRGPRGPKGFPGKVAACTPGPPGQPGENGPAGKDGPPGRPGKPGANGRNGQDGGPGRSGRRGPKGPPGPPGPPGADGIPGKPGSPGKRGKNGKRGPTGFVGPKGRSGKRGPTGRRGKTGLVGKTGSRGKTGRQGSIGRRGPAGAPGQPGLQGKLGKPGRRGPRGYSGKPGRQGSRGPRGKPGIPGKIITHYKNMGHCTGKVIDAHTGMPLPNARLFFYKENRVSTRTKSHSNGRYVASLEPGVYTIKATKGGYIPAKRHVRMVGTGVVVEDIVLSPQMQPNVMRFILTWSRPGIKLQSFLSVPGGCVVSDAKKVCHSPRSGRATFDQEKCKGHGPQTITVYRWSAGTYYYFVRQTSLVGRLSFSKAIVRVIQNSKTTAYRVGSYGKVYGTVGKGRSWCVMKLEGGKVNEAGLGDAVCDCSNARASTTKAALNDAVKQVRMQRAAKALKELKKLPFCPADKPHGLKKNHCVTIRGASASGRSTTYKLCEENYLTAHATGSRRTPLSLGRFSAYNGNTEVFTGGSATGCGGRARSANIKMVTGGPTGVHKIVSIAEPRKCHYEITLQVGTKCIQRPVSGKAAPARRTRVERSCSPRSILANTDYHGSDIVDGGIKTSTARDCCAKCATRLGCTSWTYATCNYGNNRRKGTCWLKRNSRGKERQQCRTAGKIVTREVVVP